MPREIKFLSTLITFAVCGILLAIQCRTSANEIQVDANEKSGGLLAKMPNWGMPPLESWPEEQMDLPHFKGWYRFLGSMPSLYFSKLVLTENAVIFDMYSDWKNTLSLTAYGLESGEVLWKHDIPNIFELQMLAADESNVYFVNQGVTTAISATSGDLLWSSSRFEPIAACGGYLWTLDYIDKIGTDYPEGIALLSAKDGQAVFEALLGRIYGAGADYFPKSGRAGNFYPFTIDAERLAVKTKDEIHVFQVDGTWKNYKAKFENRGAGFLFSGESLFISEYFDPNEHDRIPGADEYYAAMNLRMLDLGSGDIKWDFDYEGTGYNTWNSKIFGFRDTVAICKASGLLAFDIKTGNTIFEFSPDYSGPRLSGCPHGEFGIYTEDPFGEFSEAISFGLLNPRTKVPFIKIATNCNVEKSAVCNKYLVLTGTTETMGHSFWGANGHLIVAEIGTDGMPVHGELEVAYWPSSNKDLVDRFYSLAKPSSDSELMKEIVAQGAKAFRPILKRSSEATPAQLDDMVALAVYLDTFRGSNVGINYPARGELFNYLDTFERPGMAGQIIGWIKDDTLTGMRSELIGLLASAGGEEAKGFLDGHYRGYINETRLQAQGPYRLVKPEIVQGRMEKRIEEIDDVWFETTDGIGTRYLVYISPGLVSARDIYIAIDGDRDGLYEEVLPTGLADVYFFNYHPGGIEGLKKRLGPLHISVEGDDVILKHHEPVISENKYSEGEEDEYSVLKVDSANYLTSKLSLTELRRDSDGDGLTDILESLLLTDPANVDSDGDGIDDYRDPYPNVSLSSIKAEDRALSRAIAYFCNDLRFYQPETAVEGHPWKANYIAIDGAEGAGISIGKGVYTISVNSPDMQEKFKLNLKGYNFDSLILAAIQDNLAYIGLPLSGHQINMTEIGGELYPVQTQILFIS